MASQVRLTYTDPETSSPANTDLDVLSVRGWYDFDSVQFFPPIQNKYLSGAVDEQISGLQRVIDVDFGVVSSFANRKAILYFLKDPDRILNLVISAPTGFTGSVQSGVTDLASATYYYRVTAVDNVGETTGAAEETVVIADNLNEIPRVSWNAVSGATKYRIYRTTVSGNYTGVKFLREQTALTYDDNGSITLTSTYILPSVQALTVASNDPGGFSNEWLHDVQFGRRFKVSLLDRTLRTTLRP